VSIDPEYLALFEQNYEWVISVVVVPTVGFIVKRRYGKNKPKIGQSEGQREEVICQKNENNSGTFHIGDKTTNTTVSKTYIVKEPTYGEKDPEVMKAFAEAVEAVQEQKETPNTFLDPDLVDQALKELAKKKTIKAEYLFKQSLEHHKESGEKANKEAAKAARHLGILAYLHNTHAAIEYYQQAVKLDPYNPDGWNFVGHLLKRLGKIDDSKKAYDRVLNIGKETGDRISQAIAYGNIGGLYFTRGNLDQAEELSRKSLAINEELGRKEGMANQYGNLGILYIKRGYLDQAEVMYLKSLAINEALGRKEGMAEDYGNQGNLYFKRGDLDQAEVMYRKSLAITEELDIKEGMAVDYGNLGILYFTRGDLDQAEVMYLKSLAINEALGSKEGMAMQYVTIGLLNKTQDKNDLAQESYKKSLALFQQIGMLHMVKRVQVLLD